MQGEYKRISWCLPRIQQQLALRSVCLVSLSLGVSCPTYTSIDSHGLELPSWLTSPPHPTHRAPGSHSQAVCLARASLLLVQALAACHHPQAFPTLPFPPSEDACSHHYSIFLQPFSEAEANSLTYDLLVYISFPFLIQRFRQDHILPSDFCNSIWHYRCLTNIH